MINKVTLIGNLGRDPEVRRLESGAVVAKFSVATNENYMDRNTNEWKTQTEWHDIVAWRNLAERVERDLKKGKLVFIEGKLTHRKYTDKNNIDRYITEVVANNIKLLERREGGGSFGSNMPTEEPAAVSTYGQSGQETTQATTVNEPTAKPAGDVDDLPF